ncbi:MAG TPA: GC-type dockerin domain-anchored protein [Phycisphaerales bacterium]|nr:GC-type dockerin domain-anchored protein [Phycisphaerales bacterium]
MSIGHRTVTRMLDVVGALVSGRGRVLRAGLMVPVTGLALLTLPGTSSMPFAPATAVASEEAVPPGRAALESIVITGDIPTFYVSSLGGGEYLPPSDGGVNPAACDNVSTHTDATFEGGSYVIQAGFAETEIAAASYTIPASSFPIQIQTTEIIIAQQNAISLTTTKWTMMFWSGKPNTGTLVASYSSDGDILPHIVLGPGTTGTNLMFGIDPGDPEQIIINAPSDGSNTFTIGFRIDDHNAQTGNGCGGSVDIPNNRNAFPTTDVSGLAQPAGNWLRGVNCGAFGCPPNGGWTTFQSLNQLCRPSGDWVMRASWRQVNCQPGVGACCLPNGSCQVLTESSCLSQAGQYKGDGSACNAGTCPAPTGACCFSNNFCLTLAQVDCTGAGGTWLGGGTSCAGNQCPTGACCLPLGNCITTSQADCTSQGGTFQGLGTSCGSTNCPQPTGACCLGNGFCLQLTQADCTGIPGATFSGPLTTCADGNGNGTADICEPDLCPSDFDQSGFVDIEDYTAFVLAFEAGTEDADFDSSGFVDIEDFTGFVIAFESGC